MPPLDPGTPAPALAGVELVVGRARSSRGPAPTPGASFDLGPDRPALLLFVAEACPTSALALRRLGSAAAALGGAGVQVAAVFEDPPEVAARVARRLGWPGSVLSQPPPYAASAAYGLDSVPSAFVVEAGGQVAATAVGWDAPGLDHLLAVAVRLAGSGAPAPRVTTEPPLRKPGCASKHTLDPAVSAVLDAAGTLDELEEMFDRGWTDGLPTVPPTPERVAAMLGGLDGSRSLGDVPPVLGAATLERVAACAVLAGCRPSYFPVVVAAVEAALDPAFNLHGQAVTTQPAGQLVVVNGPVREAIGLNSGMGALGPGWRANATIGRALRLVVTLTGGGAPGRLDRSTLAQPGKIGICLAEDEETSPWEPLHVERGYPADASVVTVVACDAPLSVSDHRSRSPGELARVLGRGAATLWSPNWWPIGAPTLFVVCPQHVARFRAAGWSKQRARQAIFDAVTAPAGTLCWGETTPAVQAADPDARVHKWTEPADIVLLVAGGEAGGYSAVFGPCTGMQAKLVSREVAWTT